MAITGHDLHECIRIIQEGDRKVKESKRKSIAESPKMKGYEEKVEIGGSNCFTYEQLLAILEGVASAVEHLQSCGLVHCDIKPSNVMFNS